jgi:anaerobic magnesium-protoporphyrin IX monomethyl ester cyclase
MKTLLLFPPYWTPAMPHLALPALSSFLRARGVEVIQRDLNIEVFAHILTRDYIEKAIGLLRQASRHPPAGQQAAPRDRMRWALAAGPELAAQVDQAVQVMRSPAFLDGPAGLQAFLTIVQSLEVASLPRYPAALDLLGYTPPAPVNSSRSLLQAVRDEQHNIFLEIFRRRVIPDIVRERPAIVGISIPTEGQMLAGMTLAHLIKQAGLNCHVTVGGPHITMLREQIPRVPALFRLIDSAVAFEGEWPLLRLAETLEQHGDLAQVPNLIWRDGEQARVNEPLPPPLPYEERGARFPLPTGEGGRLPDFDGLPLDRYLSPYPVLPLLTAHGCYHGNCAFCNVGYGRTGHYRPLPAELIVEQMLALHRKYGVRHIFFADEAMTPRTLREMSALLEVQGGPAGQVPNADGPYADRPPTGLPVAASGWGGSPFYWGGCMRFERVISRELLERISRAGCRMILFGLETASERMIECMGKGTQRQHMSRILRASAGARIWNHTFFFFGFPTETMADAQDTADFVYAHGDVIHSASPGKFVLERYSPVHREPGRFGVHRIIEKPEQDLAIYFDYELESGLDEATASTITERLLDVLPRKRYGQYYAQDAYRLVYASYLYEQGQPLPPWLADEL